ncbi:MAG: hypothetical protein KBD64_05060 [Gammaproteobacteria bacterium]|nr:hypothetical protein [Gammaproteobacteria bacterium]
MAKDHNPKQGLPNKQQLIYMLQRYTNIQLVPLDNGQDPLNISSETAQFKKPIFIDTDLGKMSKKIDMAMQHQAAFPHSDDPYPSRILLEGNLSLVRKAMDAHTKLLGDDPYNPQEPYEHPLSLMEGVNIPEYDAFELPDVDDSDIKTE